MCSMPMSVLLEEITSINHLPNMWKQTSQTETSKWIICLKISSFPQSQSGGGNTSIPLGSPLAKQILTTCKIFSKESIICLVIPIVLVFKKKKKEKKTSTQILEHYTGFILKKKSKNAFFNSEPDGEKKTNVFHLKKGNTWELSKIFLPSFFFFFSKLLNSMEKVRWKWWMNK